MRVRVYSEYPTGIDSRLVISHAAARAEPAACPARKYFCMAGKPEMGGWSLVPSSFDGGSVAGGGASGATDRVLSLHSS